MKMLKISLNSEKQLVWPNNKIEQAQRRPAAETATRKLIGHFKCLMYDFLQASQLLDMVKR